MTADFTVNNQGTLFLLTAQSGAARAWVNRHIPADTTRWGASVVVEHRFALDILRGIATDGLSIKEEN